MTAKPDLQTDADEWRGDWINFYQYREGQAHLGNVVSATRAEADEVRANWFVQAEEQAKNGLVLSYHLTFEESFWIPADCDEFPDDSGVVVKARNCTFSIAIPYLPSKDPPDDDIPF
jgi:hypothetical protein